MKKIITILLVICVMLGNISLVGISAMEMETTKMEEELSPMCASTCEDTYSTRAWNSITEAANYYKVPEDKIYSCKHYNANNKTSYSYYAQMHSFRIYFNLG